MIAQAQEIDRNVSVLKLELFRQIDRLSFEELIQLAEQFELDVELDEAEEEEVKLTPEELAQVINTDPSVITEYATYDEMEYPDDADEGEETVALAPEELAEVVSFEPYDGPTTFQGDLDEGYAAKHADEKSKREAHAWIEGTINFEEINRL